MSDEDPAERVERCEARRRELEAEGRAGRVELASAAAFELIEEITALRRVDVELALDVACETLDAVIELTRAEAVRYLPVLARATEALARCAQQAGRYEQAVAAFTQAIEAQRILVASGAASAEATPAELELLELMSSRALALAQTGQLASAYAAAAAFVERARQRLPRSLPLLTGGLAFMADLAGDLGKPEAAQAHLVEGLRALELAVDQGLPGAGPAAARIAERLSELARSSGGEPSPAVAELLTKFAPSC